MKFEVVVRSAALGGEISIPPNCEVPAHIISVSDRAHVIEVEQFLERITGHRWRINEVPQCRAALVVNLSDTKEVERFECLKSEGHREDHVTRLDDGKLRVFKS